MLCITNSLIKRQSFVYIQLNDQKFVFQEVQFSISHLLAFSLNVKQFYLTNRYDTIKCYLSGPECTQERWQWRDTLHSTKLQHYWRFTIRLFSVIPKTLVLGVLSLSRDAVGVLYSPSRLGQYYFFGRHLIYKNIYIFYQHIIIMHSYFYVLFNLFIQCVCVCLYLHFFGVIYYILRLNQSNSGQEINIFLDVCMCFSTKKWEIFWLRKFGARLMKKRAAYFPPVFVNNVRAGFH